MTAPNPLDGALNAFDILLDAISVALRAVAELEAPPKPGTKKTATEDMLRSILSGTVFSGVSHLKASEQVRDARENLASLMAFGMFARFESHVREEAAKRFQALSTAANLPGLARLSGDAKNPPRWPITEMIELFGASAKDKSNIREMNEFRRAVAHGKEPNPKVAPSLAYQQLNDFLEHAGLL